MKAFNWVQVRICSVRSAPQFKVGREMTPQAWTGAGGTSTAEVRDRIIFPQGRVPASRLDAITSGHALV